MPTMTSPTAMPAAAAGVPRRRPGLARRRSTGVELQLAEVAAAIVLIAIARAGHLGPPHRRTGVGQRDQHPVAALGIERAEREKLRGNGSRRHGRQRIGRRQRRAVARLDPAVRRLPPAALAASPSAAAAPSCLCSRGRRRPVSAVGGGGNKTLNNSMIAADSIRNAIKRR